KAKQVEKSIGINQLKQQVRTYFLQITYLDNNEKELKSLDSIYRDFIRIAEVRFNAGDTKKVDINTAQAKQGEINLLYKQNETLKRNRSEERGGGKEGRAGCGSDHKYT